MCTNGCVLFFTCRSLAASLFSLSVFALSTNQTSRCFVRALYHLLLILLLLLLLFLFFASSSSCCCNVVMEVKRRAYMKTSLQFNVRTWHSAATSRWPFRYSNWWLSFLRSVLIRSSTHSLSLHSLRLFWCHSLTKENHTALAYLHAYTCIQTYIFFLTFMIVYITKSLRLVARLSKIYIKFSLLIYCCCLNMYVCCCYLTVVVGKATAIGARVEIWKQNTFLINSI